MTKYTQAQAEKEQMMNETHKAWVVFTGQTDLPWLWVLRRGFRHCFVVLKTQDRWISIDPLAHKTEIGMHALPSDFDLPSWLEKRGLTVIETEIRSAPKCVAPPMMFTCVELVKRVLGLHDWKIITPWQLYRQLEEHHLQIA